MWKTNKGNTLEARNKAAETKRKNAELRKEQRLNKIRICENEQCKKEFTLRNSDLPCGSGRFCSKKCSMKRILSTESKQQISNKLKGKPTWCKGKNYKKKVINRKEVFKSICTECKKEFQHTKRSNGNFCSKSCIGKFSSRKRIEKEKQNNIDGNWEKRWKKKPSYAEEFFIKVLNNLGVKYEPELSVYPYYIDFAIEKTIALEIDGSQHLRNDIKLSDEKKDKFLTDRGWIVHRIAWKSINHTKGKIYIKNEIDKLKLLLQKYNIVFKQEVD